MSLMIIVLSTSTSMGSLPHIEVKPQKACVLCRRSKVKCIHDGAPPCKRCRDTNQEAQCKFRLRADDETWRERTDDVLSRLGDSPIDPNAPLDPELGIGVEEITGACIAACWLGGQTALSIARLARYWAIGYLEHFEVRSAQTLGEWMTILPPFRQIDLVGKLRIWLMSYITEAQQAVINDQPSLFPDSEPAHYCQGLLNASSHSAELGEAFAPNDGVKKANDVQTTPNSSQSQSSALPPPPSDGTGGIGSFTSDRQLVAHARMMSILLAAQDLHRSARAAAADQTSSRSPQDTKRFEASHMVERWREWLEELNRWRLLTSQHSDLSDSSLESIDLSLLYHLSRTFLASHPLDPELGILDETQHALRAASNANPPDFSRLAVAQLRTISTAKHSALFALKLATDEFGEKLSYLPQFYHWLLGHAAGLLLLLVQRREVFLMAKEAESLLEVTEKFVQLYVFRITSHSFHSATSESGVPRERSGIKRSASDADLRDGLGEERRKGADGDPLNFQWPFMSGFPTSAQPAAAAVGNSSAEGAAGIPTPPNPILQQQLNHGNPAEKHPALANAQALARALYLVKMQVHSLDVQF
uniref:Zn(2)-C6 fungal-type domain-containing protein n=1 Tax=Kalmanozyma brasiliensis (strain GHG001) TaxID=1365824 RepID=V5F1F5_KALBG